MSRISWHFALTYGPPPRLFLNPPEDLPSPFLIQLFVAIPGHCILAFFIHRKGILTKQELVTNHLSDVQLNIPKQ